MNTQGFTSVATQLKSGSQHKKEKSHLGIVSLGAYQYCFVGDVEPQQVEQVDFDTDQASSDLWYL